MTDGAGVKSSRATRSMVFVEPLDDARWQAWKAKGDAHDKRGLQIRTSALTLGLTIALLALVGFWSQFAPYEIVIRCLIATAAITAAAHAIHNRHYAIAAVFAGLVIFYNPITPLFTLAGNWQRALILLSAVPFAASLAKRDLAGARIG